MGRNVSPDSAKTIKPYNHLGYWVVGLQLNGKSTTFRIHRLLATTFIKNPLQRKIINHKDGNKSNNKLHNLEWCTHQENMIHAAKTGLIKKREISEKLIHNAAKSGKKIAQFDLRGQILNVYFSIHEAAKRLNISTLAVYESCEMITKIPRCRFWFRYLPAKIAKELNRLRPNNSTHQIH